MDSRIAEPFGLLWLLAERGTSLSHGIIRAASWDRIVPCHADSQGTGTHSVKHLLQLSGAVQENVFERPRSASLHDQ